MNSREIISMTWEEFEAGIGKSEPNKIQFSMVEHLVFPFEKSKLTVLAPGWTVIEGERVKTPRLPIKISDLEKIVPFLLEKEGLIERLETKKPSNRFEQQKPSIIGNTIHELSALFNVVIQGYGAENIKKVLPTLGNTNAEKRLDRYQAIVDGFYVKDETYQDYLDLFDEIIDRRRSIGGLVKDGMGSMFDRVPGRNVAEEKHYVYEDETLESIEHLFAEFFARELVSAKPIIWSFMRDTKVTCETVIINNFKKDYPIQSKGAVDLLMRRQNSRGKYIAWLVDIKTGEEGASENPLEKGIIYRQNQLYALMASSFTTNDALMNQEWINPPRVENRKKDKGNAFIFSLNPERLDLSNRIHKIDILRFNPVTGTAKLEEILLPTKDSTFLPWLAWLARGITQYRAELWDLINSDIKYDLKNTKLG